jgi:hypothetical protein
VTAKLSPTSPEATTLAQRLSHGLRRDSPASQATHGGIRCPDKKLKLRDAHAAAVVFVMRGAGDGGAAGSDAVHELFLLQAGEPMRCWCWRCWRKQFAQEAAA